MENRINVIEVREPQTAVATKPAKKRGLLKYIIMLVIFIAVCLAAILLVDGRSSGGSQVVPANGRINMHSPYVGELFVTGEIGGGSGSVLGGSDTGYQHQWTLNRIDDMIDDKNNKGILLCIDTPGGAVYETDELYLKLREYEKVTGRPVYTYMESQATSGGYYISAASNKIYANRNCWTGSIGVIVGPLYDVKDLLDKYGVRTVTITSGANKGMGSSTSHMTKEQKDILQAAVDEAYDQFVDAVVSGRHMNKQKVKELADGRLYTARQAKDNGLIDEIGTKQGAYMAMKRKYHLEGVKLTPILYDPERGLMDKLINSFSGLKKGQSVTELEILQNLMEKSGRATIAYVAPIEK